MTTGERPICGGFFIGHPVPRPDYLSSALLPDTIFTVSACITDLLPDSRSFRWKDASEEERRRLEVTWGLDGDRLAAIGEWADAALGDGRLLWPDVFPSPDVARSFLRWSGVVPDRCVLLGIGLHPSEREEFLAEESSLGQVRQIGIVEMIRDGTAMPDGGQFLGWEILGLESGGDFHSWLCNGLEVEVDKRLGIRPNERGFIAERDHAAIAAKLCGDDEVGAEPVSWRAWAVVQYPAR